ncbi:hypothetical protein STRTUCAR8_01265 [Streptomyces turgidiscabies Car8]|uniref:Uncharacterized protein n=1 Tax=Streptomyces turgidiscabies (strain Car8) TaxID=698760 RepID=L7EZQ9_STRT8|nr:hypothetical protein STRTUCAR8_01265 [Streptomyces turgidiscabies Car8]
MRIPSLFATTTGDRRAGHLTPSSGRGFRSRSRPLAAADGHS